MDIYQQIWNADQSGSGIPAILPGGNKDEAVGYVVVKEQGKDKDHVIFPEVKIPDSKIKTYRLCETLLNNYALSQTKSEDIIPEEIEEVQTFLETILKSPPMMVAREYVQSQIGQTIVDERWYQILHDIWFRRFNTSSGRDLTGFEHVIVGEQKGSKVGGYHFWYKYYLDDIIGFLGSDDIYYIGTRYDGQNQTSGKKTTQGVLIPEVVTLAYKWDAYDYEAKVRRPLFKSIGGFWVGCSIEGLMALGTVRCYLEARAPKETIINNGKYALKVFRSSDGRSMRTFYPVFLGLTTAIPVPPGGGGGSVETVGNVRIVAALVNPKGDDRGQENVTLLNLSPDVVDLTDWVLKDNLNNALNLSGKTILAGETLKIELGGRDVILSNRGGEILLFNRQNQVHKVSYTDSDVSQQGWTTVF